MFQDQQRRKLDVVREGDRSTTSSWNQSYFTGSIHRGTSGSVNPLFCQSPGGPTSLTLLFYLYCFSPIQNQ